MSFLDTEPAAIQRLDAAGPWARFRVTDPRRRDATLRELCRGDVPLTIGAAGGPTLTALLWSIEDTQRRSLHLSVPPEVPNVDAVIAAPALWAAGYLHDVKVQFDISGLALQPQGAGQRRMLQAAAPQTMVLLPRRKAVRVRRAETHASTVCLRYPQLPDRVLRLRVADISMTGCALWLPAGEPTLPRGSLIRAAEVELDEECLFFADLTVQHLTITRRSPAGVRAGCAWDSLGMEATETLRRWIGRGRRRRDLLSLSFD